MEPLTTRTPRMKRKRASKEVDESLLHLQPRNSKEQKTDEGQYLSNDSDADVADDTFSLIRAKILQLEQVVQEFNHVLKITELESYFNTISVKLEHATRETRDRLEEISIFYSWLNKMPRSLSNSTSAGYFSFLPEEISLYILSFLSVKQLAQISQVSRYWRRLSEDDQLWHKLHSHKWKTPTFDDTDTNLSVKKQENEIQAMSENSYDASLTRPVKKTRIGWKDKYLERHTLDCNWNEGRYTSKEMYPKSPHGESVYCLKFDDRLVVTGSNDRTVQVCDLQTKKVLHVLQSHTAEVRAVDFNQDYLVSGSRDRTVKVWDINTGQCLQTLDDHSGPVKCLQVHHNLFLSGSEDASMKLYDKNVGKHVLTFRGHVWGVACLQFNQDTIVSGSRDRRVILWDIKMATNSAHQNVVGGVQGKNSYSLILEGHENTVRCVAFDSKNIISGSWDKNIRVWDRNSGEKKTQLEGHKSRVLCLAFDDERIVSGSVDNSVKVWNFEKDYPIHSIRLHSAPIYFVKLDKDKIVSGSRDNQVFQCDFKNKDL